MHLFIELRRHYGDQGFDVYSRFFPPTPAVPPGWNGPVPDMIVDMGDRRLAIFRENAETLQDPDVATRWKEVLQNNNTSLRLFLDTSEEMETAREILEREPLSAQLALVHKHRFRRPHHRAKPSELIRKLGVLAAVIGLVILASLLLLWLGSAMYRYNP